MEGKSEDTVPHSWETRTQDLGGFGETKKVGSSQRPLEKRKRHLGLVN